MQAIPMAAEWYEEEYEQSAELVTQEVCTLQHRISINKFSVCASSSQTFQHFLFSLLSVYSAVDPTTRNKRKKIREKTYLSIRIY